MLVEVAVQVWLAELVSLVVHAVAVLRVSLAVMDALVSLDWQVELGGKGSCSGIPCVLGDTYLSRRECLLNSISKPP